MIGKNRIAMKKFLILFLLFLSSCSNDDLEIIENPITGVKIQVAKKDFSNKMRHFEAMEACESLGKGWRLPSRDELKELYLNKKRIGGFSNGFYWSSVSADSWNYYWGINFESGKEIKHDFDTKSNVRAIRDL
jgi:hypothetical protein